MRKNYIRSRPRVSQYDSAGGDDRKVSIPYVKCRSFLENSQAILLPNLVSNTVCN